MGTLKRWLHFFVVNDAVRDAALRINNRRLFTAAMVALPVHLAHVLVFWLAVPTHTPIQELWRLRILYAHGALAVVTVAFIAASRWLRDTRSSSFWLEAVQHLALVTILLAGIGITAIDQLVRNEMTPFLMACVICASLFLIPPGRALILYPAAYGLFYYAMGRAQPDPIILFSNWVNGITATGIALGLSLILWNGFLRELHHQQQIAQHEEEIRRKNAELERLASIDPLTGLMNRRSFQEAVQREVSLMQRSGGESCLGIVDIDHFKRFNDDHGHLMGDELLKRFAHILTQQARPQDLVARWGGEEFLILFPKTPLEEARIVAEHLRAAVEEGLSTGPPHIPVTASFGLARLDPRAADPFVHSYREADRALYAAKKAGRNQVQIQAGANADKGAASLDAGAAS